MDEVTVAKRQLVRAWLKDIVAQFRHIRVIVTSRPAAAGSDWLRAEGFGTAFLEQLAPADVRTLVQHWHTAVRECPDLPCAPERLPSYEARLLARLEAAPHLRTLASSPLLAAMLCALNLDREALPRNRMGLYAAALDMLLETRDTKRGIPSSLERDQKIRILQDVAWHLSTSARVELPKPMVERLVADRLASMPQVRVPPDTVLDELLQRSGILREPVPGRIDFVHRTVQEYLTAKQAADLGDMDLLVRNAHLDTWRETVIMAAGHANDPLRRELLTGILARARSEQRRARVLKLVAVACLETLPSVPDDLRDELDRCLDDLVPPRNEAAARSLATAGEPVLARLPETLDGLSTTAVKATVHAAWLINGPAALDVLARYAADGRPSVRRELAQAWDYFDTDEFAERVLVRLPAGSELTLLRSPHQVRRLDKVPPLADLFVLMDEIPDFGFLSPHTDSLTRLALRSYEPMADPASLPPLPALRSLTYEIVGRSDLGFLDGLPRLDRLSLHGCEMVTDYAPVRRQTELTELALSNCPRLTSLSMLGPLGSLRGLRITGSRLGSANGLEEVCEAAPDLRDLSVGHCDWVTDLRPLTGLPLTGLYLYGCENVTDFDPISSLSELRNLNMYDTAIEDLSPVRSLANLEGLYLMDCRRLTDLRPLADLPNLEVLALEDAAPGLDLSPLAVNRKLTVRIAAGQDVRGAEGLGRRLKIT
ncbi:hypothetical protein [Actinomadura sp. 9N215]|uniref:hypothetical protein n=1 Tax=Actinomadura sp. 9N215 TaxID=3375150 RepID=UPI00378D20FE